MGSATAKQKTPPLFSMQAAAAVVSGRLRGRGECSFSSCAVHSKQAGEGVLFVALKGERTDGHLFLLQALQAGCRCFFVSEASLELPLVREALPQIEAAGGCVAVVESPLAALQVLAAAHLKRFPRLIRIGVTGSSGKTTTKELLGAMLSEKYRVCMTEGNLNSEIGLPLMALRVREADDILLLEMGIDRFGEMERMVSVFQPQFALITSIGTAHIGVFGSKAAIAAQKGKIFSAFNDSSCAFVNEADSFAIEQANAYPGKTLLYGTESCRVQGSDLGLLGWDITLASGERGRLPLIGRYNLINFCGAYALSHSLGVSDAEVLKGAAQVRPLFGRGTVRSLSGSRGKLFLIEDCYNANAESMRASLHFFSELRVEGRKLAVIASMKDLGEKSEAVHRSVGKTLSGLIAERKMDWVAFFGEEMRWAADEMTEGEHWRFFSEMDALKAFVASMLSDGDCWLLKGSRAMALERLEPVFEAF